MGSISFPLKHINRAWLEVVAKIMGHVQRGRWTDSLWDADWRRLPEQPLRQSRDSSIRHTTKNKREQLQGPARAWHTKTQSPFSPYCVQTKQSLLEQRNAPRNWSLQTESQCNIPVRCGTKLHRSFCNTIPNWMKKPKTNNINGCN